jgi:hypothetical protein
MLDWFQLPKQVYAMKNKLSLEHASDIIASSFLPFRCFVDLTDGETRVAFRVLDHKDNALFSVDGLFAQNVSDVDRLDAVLTQARVRVAAEGVTLAPWHFPQT